MQPTDGDIVRQFAAAYGDPALVVLEGFHPARHAVRFGATLHLAVTNDRRRLFEMAHRVAPEVVAGIERVVRDVESETFDKLSPRTLSSPLLSIASRPPVDLGGALARRERPVVFLENPRDPGNVGAAIRVAAAADVAAVLVSGQVDPWSPVVLRSATGLQFAVEVGSAELPLETDRPIVAVDAGGEPLQGTKLDVDSVLVIGGERYGLSPATRKLARRTIAIPMRAGVSSLNLATAVSAVLFSWRTGVLESTGSYPW